MLSNKSLKGTIIFSFFIKEYKKNPIVTIANLKDRAAKGDASSTMTLPDMKAEDQSRIKKSGKSFIIYQKNIYF